MADSSNLAYVLENNNHKRQMTDTFYDYLSNESMVDVMLCSSEGTIIKAHKMILSTGSEYFRNICDAFKNPFNTPVIVLKDIPFRDLKAIVDYIYRGEIVVPMGDIPSILKSAESLFVKGLEKYINKSSIVSSRANNDSKTIFSDSIHKSVDISVLKGKQSVKESKPSFSMNLRNTRRPNYKYLSNGYMYSDTEVSNDNEFDQNIELKQQFSDKYMDSDVNQSSSLRQTRSQSKYVKKEIISRPLKSESTSNHLIENSINYSSNHLSTTNTKFTQIKNDSKETSKVNKCHLCQRIFAKTSSLNSHITRIHSEDNTKYMCPICGKRYSWLSSLNKHIWHIH